MSIEDVLGRVKELVAAGEYLDSIPGVPGENLSGGGWFRQRGSGARQRICERGSPEFLAAKEQGLIERLPPLTVATHTEVEEAEALLGRHLPPLLRRLYLEVGDGGFGPGYGLLGLRHGHCDDTQRTALDLYKVRTEWWPLAPDGLFPICHWGCAIYSLVDCSTEHELMWAYDPNPVPQEELDQALFPQDIGLEEWLERWVNRKLLQPCLTQDEASGLWRGATDDEIAGWMSTDN